MLLSGEEADSHLPPACERDLVESLEPLTDREDLSPSSLCPRVYACRIGSVRALDDL
jgi:hypothetical protein